MFVHSLTSYNDIISKTNNDLDRAQRESFSVCQGSWMNFLVVVHLLKQAMNPYTIPATVKILL